MPVKEKMKNKPLGKTMSLDDAIAIVERHDMVVEPKAEAKKEHKKLGTKPSKWENIGQRKQLKRLEKEGY